MSINKLLEEIDKNNSSPSISNYSPSSSSSIKNNKLKNTGLPFLSNIKSNIKNLNPELKIIIKNRYDKQTNLLFEQLNNIQRKTTPEQFKSFIKPILSKYEEWYKLAEEEAKKLKTYIDIFQTKNSNIYLPGLSEKLSSLRINLIDPFNDFRPSLSDDSKEKRTYRTDLIKTFMRIQNNIKENIEKISGNLNEVVTNNSYENNLLYCWIIYGNLISQFTNKLIEINKLEVLKREEERKNNFKKKDNERKDRRDKKGGGKQKDKKKKGQNGNKQKKSPEETYMDNLITKIKDFEDWNSSKFVEEQLGNKFVEDYFKGKFEYNEVDYKKPAGPVAPAAPAAQQVVLPDRFNSGKYNIGKFENYKLNIDENNLDLKVYIDNIIENNVLNRKKEGLINNIIFVDINKDQISKKEIPKLKEQGSKNQRNKENIKGYLIKDTNNDIEKYYSLTTNEFEKELEKSKKLKEYYKNYNLKNFNRIKEFPNLVSEFKNTIIKNVFEYCFFTVEFLGEFIKQIRLKYDILVEQEKPREERKNNKKEERREENSNKNENINENKIKNKKKALDELYKARDELYKEKVVLIKKLKEKISNEEREEIKILIDEISEDFNEIKKEIQKLKNT
jgi:hypothetical protein